MAIQWKLPGSLDSFILDVKLKRWLRILQELEGNPVNFEEYLVNRTGSNTRLLNHDITTMQEYFGSNLNISKNNKKIECHLKSPAGYVTAKEQLLQKEPIFELINQLFLGIYRSRKEWEQTLNVRPGDFYQIKKQINKILSHYEVSFEPAESGLIGDEANIRRFYYHFYFELGIYPPNVELVRQRLYKDESDKQLSLDWGIDNETFLKWNGIFNQRQKLGYYLKEPVYSLDSYQKLAVSLYQNPSSFLPIQENAVLFLLSIEKEIYSSYRYHKRFVDQFVDDSVKEILSTSLSESEQDSYAVGGYIYFMEQLFFGPSDYRLSVSDKEKIGKKLSLQGLNTIDNHLKKSSSKGNSDLVIYIDWHLRGSTLIKTWIKDQFEKELSNINIQTITENGLSINKEIMFAKISIRNNIYETEGNYPINLVITEVPSNQEIKVACQYIKREIERGISNG